MKNQELINYLTTAYNLESRIYEIEQFAATFKAKKKLASTPVDRLKYDTINKLKPYFNSAEINEATNLKNKKSQYLSRLQLAAPQKPSILNIDPGAKPANPPAPSKAKWLFLIAGTISFIIGVNSIGSEDFTEVGIILIICAIFMLLGAIGIIMSEKQARAQYEHNLSEYYLKKCNYDEQERKFQQQRSDYQKKLSAAKHEFEEAEQACLALQAQAMNTLKDTVIKNERLLQNTLGKLYQTREKLYNTNVIFPKYRTLPCISTMLEYLQAGRVSELEGANGAYNLYEAELRMNMVIANLDQINEQLNTIKQNQFNLYQAVCDVNSTLSKIDQQMQIQVAQQQKMLKGQETQLALAVTTARCAAATAASTEALKYISLVS